jgi:hypothetical protein
MGLPLALSALMLFPAGESRASAASGGSEVAPDHWTWRFVPYVFAVNLEGTLSVGANEFESEVEFADLFEALDFGFMALFEGRRGQWGFALDGAYVDLATDGEGAVASELDVTMQFQDALALYRISPTSPVELALGARYLALERDVEVGPFQSDADDDVLDAIAGARSTWSFAERWRFALYGDFGTGDSDLTWQGIANLGYDFGAWGLNLGYRVLDYDFEQGSAEFDMAMKGWQFGVEYRW